MSAPEPSNSSSRGLKYGIKTLLIGVGVAAVFTAFGAHWHDRWRAAETAREEFAELKAEFDVYLAPRSRYFQQSCALCIAECAVPLADRTAICQKHLARMEAVYYSGETTLFSSEEGWKEYFEETSAYVRKAEAWVKAGRPLSETEQADNLSASAMVPHGRAFDYIQLVAIACLGCLGVGRMVAMYARGVKVIALDRRRTAGQLLRDFVLLSALLFHYYLALAYSWPLPEALIPLWLSSHVADTTPAKTVGTLLLAAGLVVYWLGVCTMGRSWRFGIDRQSPGGLVTRGIFRWSRNPIYVALELLTLGTMLLQGRLIFFVLAALIVALLHEQILREERFLVDRYGDPYRDYCRRVGRYVAWPSIVREKDGFGPTVCGALRRHDVWDSPIQGEPGRGGPSGGMLNHRRRLNNSVPRHAAIASANVDGSGTTEIETVARPAG